MTYNYSTLRQTLGLEPKKRLAMHTWLYPIEDGSVVIRVGATIGADIATFKPDGEIVVSANKVRSTTTRQLINQYVPLFSIVANDGLWFWVEKGDEEKALNPIALFTEGDVITASGQLKFQRGIGDALKMLEYKNKVRDYAAKYAENAPFEQPSSAECWERFIYGFGTTTIGAHDAAHIREHIDKGVILASLLRNATDGVASSMVRSYAWKGSGSKLNAEIREEIAKTMRRHLIKVLGLPAGTATAKSE